jgi:hypothetical protein
MSETVTVITTLNRAITLIDHCLSDDHADRQYCLEAIDDELTTLRDFLERRPEAPADPDPWDRSPCGCPGPTSHAVAALDGQCVRNEAAS